MHCAQTLAKLSYIRNLFKKSAQVIFSLKVYFQIIGKIFPKMSYGTRLPHLSCTSYKQWFSIWRVLPPKELFIYGSWKVEHIITNVTGCKYNKCITKSQRNN